MLKMYAKLVLRGSNMSAITKIISLFWKINEKNDNKRLSKQTEPSGLTQIKDIPYSDSEHPLKKLDVYYPEGTPEDAKLPVVIDIHGGGWYYGTKELNKNYCLSIAKRGFAVFSMSYRLAPEVCMNEQLCDVMQALKYINLHLGDYPCDKSKILLTGDSAGGQLASFAAALCRSGELRKAFDSVDPEIEITALGLTSPVAYLKPNRGLVGINFATVLGKGFENKPFGKYVDIDKLLDVTELPPAFLVTSSGDFVGREPTRRLFNDIKSRGGTAYLSDWEKTNGKDLPHVFSVLYPENSESAKAIDDMLIFFMRHSKEKEPIGR